MLALLVSFDNRLLICPTGHFEKERFEMKNTSILVVDYDPKVRSLLRTSLEGEGAIVFEASDVASALASVEKNHIDLMTLDLNLGEDDGFDLTKRVRKLSTVPIVIITDKDDVIDRVVGLELGADDYISKPFHVREIVARLKSVLRRTQVFDDKALCTCEPPCQCGRAEGDNIMAFDGLSVELDRMELLNRDGEICELTSGDFKLLSIFLTHPKRVLSRDHLMDLTGGIDWTPLDRTIDNQVARLRKKIERNPSHPVLIKTIRGVGYMFACDVTTKAKQKIQLIA